MKPKGKVVRGCSTCGKEFETSFRNHGLFYRGEKTFICRACLFTRPKCVVCGKEFERRITSTQAACSRTCRNRLNGRIGTETMNRNRRKLRDAIREG